MEPSRVAQRCLRNAITRSTIHKYPTTTQSSNNDSRCLISSRTHSIALRSFTSSTRKTQGRPSQPQPVSEELSAEDVGADAPTTPQEQIARASNREYTRGSGVSKLDLSSIPGINAHPEDSKTAQRIAANDGNISRSRPSPSPSSTPNAQAELNKLFNEASRKRQQQQQQQQQQSSSQDSNSRSPKNPWTDTLDAFSIPHQQQQQQQQQSQQHQRTKKFDLKNIISPFDPAPSLLDFTSSSSAKLPLRLRPTLGRTQAVDVARGMDLTRAFRTMEGNCIRNGVKSDMMAQRTHVRKGMAKKLNRSKRWREVFKTGFLAECGRVRRMQKQGW